MYRILNRNHLKYIAIIAMLLDHVAAIFISPSLPLYYIFRIVGRLTAPIMCYFLAEGFIHTSSKKKYGIRLAIFSLISQIPFSFAFKSESSGFAFNMIFTLFLCFLILLSYEKIKVSALKWIVIVLLMLISIWSDWGIVAPLFVLFFYIFHNKPVPRTFCYVGVVFFMMTLYIFSDVSGGASWYEELVSLGTLLFIPLLCLYNGKKGNGSAFSKWFFYAFYPIHLLILGLISVLIF